MAFATRRVVKGPGGKPHVQFVNPRTGEPIPFDEIDNYILIEQGTDLDFIDRNGTDDEDGLTEETEEEIVDKDNIWLDQHGARDFIESPSGEFNRNMSNNFGYINKPALLSVTSFVPGLVGMLGKAVNTTINMNNVAATKEARKALGLEEQSFGEAIKGILGDKKGYIGDMVIGDEQYAIGFEPSTKDNRTTLTPAEARTRSEMAKSRGQQAREATPQETKEARKENEFKSGFLGRGLNTAKEMIGEVTNPGSILSSLDNFKEASRPKANPGTPATAGTTPPMGSPVGRPAVVPGRGLANLAPNGLRGINYNMGPNRPVAPNQDIQQAALAAVHNVMGPEYSIDIISGQPGEGQPQYGSNRHNLGRAMDFDIIDPQGNKVTDRKSLEALAAEFGRQGITSLGYGEGYMGAGRFHADTLSNKDYSGGQGPVWGGDRSIAKAFMEQRTPVGILPSQVPVPTQERTPSVASEAIQGMVSRGIPDDVIQEMALTIAGELGSNTIQGILSGDPVAQESARLEIADIAATMNNRARSRLNQNLVDPWGLVTDGTQYNSRLPSNMGTTNQNFNLIGDFIQDAVGKYNTGNLVGNAPNATHYRTGYVNPSWASYAANEVQSGEHIFSNVKIPGTNQLEFPKALPNQGPVPGFADRGGTHGDTDGVASFGGSGSDGVGTGGSSVSETGSGIGVGSGGGYAGVGGQGNGTGSSFGGDDSGVSFGGLVSDDGFGGYDVYGGDFGGSGSFGSESEAIDAASGNGAFGDALGSNAFGPESLEGPAGTSPAGSGSFGGFSAGSLGGEDSSASGHGTGLGAAGTSGTGYATVGIGIGTGGVNTGGISVEFAGPAANENESSGGSAKVICGYFYAKGKIPKRIYLGDLKYAKERANKRTREGYLLWAEPLVRWLDKKPSRPIIDSLLFPFTKGWVYEMAYRVGYSTERPLWGRVVTPVVSSLCYILGYLKEKTSEK